MTKHRLLAKVVLFALFFASLRLCVRQKNIYARGLIHSENAELSSFAFLSVPTLREGVRVASRREAPMRLQKKHLLFNTRST